MTRTTGDVRSLLPPTLEGSRAKTAFGGESAADVDVKKLMPPATEDVVQPEGSAGAVTPSKFSVNVVDGAPIRIERVNVVEPRLLLTLKVKVTALPQGVPAGIVKLICRVTVAAWLIVP